MIYETEKNMKEFGDRLDVETKNRLDAAIGRLREAAKGTDVNEMKSAIDALNHIWHEASAKMYQQAGASSGQQGGYQQQSSGQNPPPPHGNDNVVDADYEVVDDKK